MAADETERIRDEIAMLRRVVDRELDAGAGADREIVLEAARLLHEKTKQLDELGWFSE
jgi:hypothetical protein